MKRKTGNYFLKILLRIFRRTCAKKAKFTAVNIISSKFDFEISIQNIVNLRKSLLFQYEN